MAKNLHQYYLVSEQPVGVLPLATHRQKKKKKKERKKERREKELFI